MGCSGSKPDDLPLVIRCRERRELIKAAANHRYALAAAHVSYFHSLKDVGDALRKFVEEELIVTSPSSSSLSSPSLILPSSKKIDGKDGSGSNGGSVGHLRDVDLDDDDGSHIRLSTDDEDSEDDVHHHQDHNHTRKHKDDSDEIHHMHHDETPQFGYDPNNGYGYGYRYGYGNGYGMANDPFAPPPQSYGGLYSASYFPTEQPVGQYGWVPAGMPPPEARFYSSNVYYMKKSAPAMKTVVQEPVAEPSNGYSNAHWNYPPPYENGSYGGYYGYFPMGSPVKMGNQGDKMSPSKEPPPPPSPKASAWDFFNPFDLYDNGYPGYYSSGRYGYESMSSSPDSAEVREREGIPDLEEETETEVYKGVNKGKKVDVEVKRSSGGSTSSSMSTSMRKNGEGSSKPVPLHKSEEGLRSLRKSDASSKSAPLHQKESSSRSLPSWSSEEGAKRSVPSRYSEGQSVRGPSPSSETSGSISLTDEKSSSETLVSKSVEDGSMKKKGVTFEVDGSSKHDADSSKLSSLTTMSPQGTRDLREVVAEIRDEFEIASSYGREVAMMLEVGKLPYQPSIIKVLLSRLLYLISPSQSLEHEQPASAESVKLASKTMKMAKSYFGDVGEDVNGKPCNLSSTLEKLYAWERRLYKEVKEEEKLRVMYEKQCERLKTLDERGADTSKIEATQASIRRLLTRLNVSIKAIDAISSRIHKLRDEELQPQIAELIQGLVRMWKSMLKCHQKQFQAIMESKMRKLKANIARTESSLMATAELERELRSWCDYFNDWINTQKSYVESLNGWLMRCLQYEPEVTPDGIVPYSPGRLGAPPVFVICNDWDQAMKAISEARVANAMNSFASSLRQLWVKQDEEQRQRLRAEYLSKDYEKHLRTHRMERGRMGREQDAMSDKTAMSVVQSESGVSPLDDLKVDLDSFRQKLAEERIKHKDAIKLVHDAASTSLKGGLVPIFKALENFTSEALKAHEHVRLKDTAPS